MVPFCDCVRSGLSVGEKERRSGLREGKEGTIREREVWYSSVLGERRSLKGNEKHSGEEQGKGTSEE